MPTYEYVCKQCGESFDVHQSFSDKPLKRHDACGGELQKVFHARGIVFRGSGFYATDGKGSGETSKETKKERQKETAKPPAKSGSGSPAKTAAKSADS